MIHLPETTLNVSKYDLPDEKLVELLSAFPETPHSILCPVSSSPFHQMRKMPVNNAEQPFSFTFFPGSLKFKDGISPVFLDFPMSDDQIRTSLENIYETFQLADSLKGLRDLQLLKKEEEEVREFQEENQTTAETTQKQKKSGSNATKWRPEYDSFIKELVESTEDEAHSISLKEIHESLVNHFSKFDIGIQTVAKHYKRIQQEEKTKLKKATESSKQNDQNYDPSKVNKEFIQKMLKIVDGNHKIVFTGVSLLESLNGVSFYLVASVSNEGLLGFQLFKGGYNSRCFCLFFENFFRRFPDFENGRVIFAVDDLKEHVGSLVEILVLKRVPVVFISREESRLNPAEMVLAIWKGLLEARKLKEEKEMSEEIVRKASVIDAQTVQWCFWQSISQYYLHISMTN